MKIGIAWTLKNNKPELIAFGFASDVLKAYKECDVPGPEKIWFCDNVTHDRSKRNPTSEPKREEPVTKKGKK